MKSSYFKSRKPFCFSAHVYDIGTFMGVDQNHDDNHFLLKIYKIPESEFAPYYSYHLSYAIDKNSIRENVFFFYVWNIVNNRIAHFERLNPFSGLHAQYKQRIQKLQLFQKYLESIDQWNSRPYPIILDQKETLIQNQKEEINCLRITIDKMKVYEVSQKIWIEKDHVATLIDLFKQMEHLKLPSGRNLIKSDHQVVFPRMIGKYFTDGGDDLSVETLRNYYVVKKDKVTSKGTEISSLKKIFRIESLKKPD